MLIVTNWKHADRKKIISYAFQDFFPPVSTLNNCRQISQLHNLKLQSFIEHNNSTASDICRGQRIDANSHYLQPMADEMTHSYRHRLWKPMGTLSFQLHHSSNSLILNKGNSIVFKIPLLHIIWPYWRCLNSYESRTYKLMSRTSEFIQWRALPVLSLLSFLLPSWRAVRSYWPHLKERVTICGDDWSHSLHLLSCSWGFPKFSSTQGKCQEFFAQRPVSYNYHPIISRRRDWRDARGKWLLARNPDRSW